LETMTNGDDWSEVGDPRLEVRGQRSGGRRSEVRVGKTES
jgi:hypothetical protein